MCGRYTSRGMCNAHTSRGRFTRQTPRGLSLEPGTCLVLKPGKLTPSLFGGRAFGDMNHHGGFIEEQEAPQSSKSKRPIIIRELSDDDHDNVEEERDEDIEVKKNPKKHSRLRKEPYVQGKKMKHTYNFSSSFVSYGGPNGPYYTASKTRMSGGDGVTIEERKEADRTTGKAAHRLSRGLRDKGHSVTRRRNSDGRVDTMQTLHNLNQDELPNFNEAWNRSAREHLPGWNQGFDMIDNGDISNCNLTVSCHIYFTQSGELPNFNEAWNGSAREHRPGWNQGFEGGGRRQNEQPSRGWALPSTVQPSTNSARARPQFHPYPQNGRSK